MNDADKKLREEVYLRRINGRLSYMANFWLWIIMVLVGLLVWFAAVWLRVVGL